MAHKIFLSVGRTSTPEQEAFVRTMETYLTNNGLTPQCVGRSVVKNQRPLKSIDECMRECAGALILAFERVHIEKGTEKRGSPNPVELDGLNLPTVWNQIEAAMAYTLGKPLFVLVERGLKNDGLLEKIFDWYVVETKLDGSILTDHEFLGVFTDWKASVEQYGAGRGQAAAQPAPAAVDVAGLTIGQIVSGLKPAQLWGIVLALLTAFSTVAVSAYQLGATVSKPPAQAERGNNQ